MEIGTRTSDERRIGWSDTGRRTVQLTSAPANSYPLYYFVPSHTKDARYLVFHSERTGWVQLHRLDLDSGEITQLTEGRTRDSGWGVWCEYRLRGIFNHLSSLNAVRGEVFYFQDFDLRATLIDSLDTRLVASLDGRVPIGQSVFSPSGNRFSFIHADETIYRTMMSTREALTNMGMFGRDDGQAWRRALPSTISTIDVDTGEVIADIELDFHVHHLLFIEENTLIINHPVDSHGMWTVGVEGRGARTLRPIDEQGVSIVHQVVTDRGVVYDATDLFETRRRNRVGRYDIHADTYEEVALSGLGYIHIGLDPAGEFLFIENQDVTGKHELLSIHHPRHTESLQLNLIKTLEPITGGQRRHAHPFLAPNRRDLVFTEVIDGWSQVCTVDVSDLVDLDDYW